MELRLRDFVGNQKWVRLLRRASLRHSMIFSGPSGVGKKTLAILLAGLANCRNPEAGDLCGACNSCKGVQTLSHELAKRNHPDILVSDWDWVKNVYKEKKAKPNPLVFPIDAVRKIIQEAQYRPFLGTRRFFILDEAEKLNRAASNAFLKTLEEPPETTCIILVTAYPDRLLPTILSRCQHVRFSPLPRNEVCEYLRVRGKEKEAELTAAFAKGSIGNALTLDLPRTLKARDLMLALLEKWVRRHSFADIFKACETAPLRQELKDREKMLQYLEFLSTLAEDLYQVHARTPARIVNLDRKRLLEELAEKVSLDWIDSFLYHVREAQNDIRAYVNIVVCFETLWLKADTGYAGTR